MRSNTTLAKDISLSATLSMMLVALASTAFAADTSKLFEKAEKEGQVRVIVGLRLPAPGFKPEGNLPSSGAVKQQREAIAATKEKLLDSLTGYEIVVYAEWNSLPYIALKANAAALEHLIQSPLVTTIQEDVPEKLNKPSATD